MSDLSWLKKLQGEDYGDVWGDRTQTALTNIIGNDLLNDWILQPRDDTTTELKLHIYGAESMNLQADITDNYVESNVAFQEHIALKPKVFTVSGEVGEVVWYKNDTVESEIYAVEQKLNPVVSFLPPISKQASSIQDKALKIMSVVDSIDNFANRVWNLLSKEDVDTEQKKSYKYLMVLWQAREPINIKTPFGNLKSYVIQNIEFTQPDRTVDKSQVKISFKEFKVVKEKVTKFNKTKYQNRKAAQMGQKQSKGTTTGVKLDYVECKPGSIFVDEATKMCVRVGG